MGEPAMPQLASGRHVGVSPHRLLDWAEHRAHSGDYLRMAIDDRMPAQLWADIDVVVFLSADGSAASPAEGEPVLAGFTVADLATGRCDWSEEERREFLAWTASERVVQWLDALHAQLLELLRSKPLPAILKGILDRD
jgi:hypothetical protein